MASEKGVPDWLPFLFTYKDAGKLLDVYSSMQRIPLSRGKYATVDDDDYDWVSQWNWCATNHGYAVRRGPDGKLILMHREILDANDIVVCIGEDVDHRNRDKADNRKENLRICSRGQNEANSCGKGGSSKYKGVFWNTAVGKWTAKASKDGKQYHGGHHECEASAARAYNKLAEELWGEYAFLNVI